LGVTAGETSRRILFVSLKKEAQPVLAQLRALGHGVSLVEDVDEASVLLGSGGFDHVVLPAGPLASMLEQRAIWTDPHAESWRYTVSGLAHDLEYLLQSLRRGLDHGGEGDREGDETVRTISVLASYLSELTDELDGGTGRPLQPTIIDLEDAIETAAVTVYPTAVERRQRLVIDVSEGVASVRADPVNLKRIMASLLDYASRHAPSSGRVRVKAYVEQDEPVICVSYPGEELTTTELQQLFSPPGEGDGSGLSRVQRLVEQHSCRLWLESEKGALTTLFLSLPRWAYVRAERVPSSVQL
jgi:signal transduction histidine kinase